MNKEKLFKFSFGIDPDKITPNVIISPIVSPKQFARLLPKDTPLNYFKGKIYSGFIFDMKKKPFTVLHTGIGPALTGDAMLLLGISPAENAVFAGSCGGLHDANIGDMMVAVEVFNGEGFLGYHKYPGYLDKVLHEDRYIEPDKCFVDTLKEYVGSKKRLNWKDGRIFTIGSLLAETDNNLQLIQNSGFDGIDMELSAFYGAAMYAGISAVALLVVSDLPLVKPLGEDTSDGIKRMFKDSYESMLELCIGFMKGSFGKK